MNKYNKNQIKFLFNNGDVVLRNNKKSCEFYTTLPACTKLQQMNLHVFFYKKHFVIAFFFYFVATQKKTVKP
jgi:hypothetical protein